MPFRGGRLVLSPLFPVESKTHNFHPILSPCTLVTEHVSWLGCWAGKKNGDEDRPGRQKEGGGTQLGLQGLEGLRLGTVKC